MKELTEREKCINGIYADGKVEIRIGETQTIMPALETTSMVKLMRFVFVSGLAVLCLTGGNLLAQEVKEVSSQPGELRLSQGNLPAGVYEITFRLKIDKKESTVSPLATLTVGSAEYPSRIWKLITPINFEAVNTPQDFTFRFDNFKTQDIQVAVTLSQNEQPVPKLTVERITITPDSRVTIATVWPGKILYYRDEEARGFVAVCNGTSVTQAVKLCATLESDLNNVRRLKEENLTLAPFERREVSLSWNTGKEEYGFALVGTLLDAQGKEISQAKEYFSVADNLWKVGITERAGAYWGYARGAPGRGCEVPYGPQTIYGPVSHIKDREKLLSAELARPFVPAYWSYGNYQEIYGWSPDCFFILAPDKDYWYGGISSCTYGKRHIQMAVEWLHRRGMRATTYVNSHPCGFGVDELYRQHPEAFVYDKNGQLSADYYYQKKLEVGNRVPGEEEGPWPLQLSVYSLRLFVNLATLESIDMLVDQMVKSQKMFGWDGVRYDNCTFPVLGYDFYGNEIGGNDPGKKDELSVRAWAHMRDSLWEKIGPNFVIGDNFDYRLRSSSPATWDEACRKGQLKMEEMSRSAHTPQSPDNRWQDFMSYYHQTGEIIRNLGGHHLIIGFDGGYPVDYLYLNIFTYAGRSHPYSYQYCSDALPLGNYAQFITRYSSLMWDVEKVKALPDPEKIIRVESPLPVWWKDYACLRQSPEGKRQYIVHLINPPVQERIYTDPANKVPLPQTGITVSLKLEKAEKITKAYLLSAEPLIYQKPLPVLKKGATVSVQVPELYFWSMVVFE